MREKDVSSLLSCHTTLSGAMAPSAERQQQHRQKPPCETHTDSALLINNCCTYSEDVG